MSEPGIVVVDEWESQTTDEERPTQRWRMTDDVDAYVFWIYDDGEWHVVEFGDVGFPHYELVPGALVSSLSQRIAQLKNGGGK